jgi:hypothetical protein
VGNHASCFHLRSFIVTSSLSLMVSHLAYTAAKCFGSNRVAGVASALYTAIEYYTFQFPSFVAHFEFTSDFGS